jgi:hypothetical protein
VATATPNRNLSRFDKVQLVIQKNFPLIWFSQKTSKTSMSKNSKNPLALALSTYLSRMANKGMLQRTGGANNLKYKTAPNITQTAIKQHIK